MAATLEKAMIPLTVSSIEQSSGNIKIIFNAPTEGQINVLQGLGVTKYPTIVTYASSGSTTAAYATISTADSK